MKEEMLFRMPAEPDLALAAIAVLQEFERKMVMTRPDWHATFNIVGLPSVLSRCVVHSERVDWYLTLGEDMWLYDKSIFDLKFDFDVKAAYNISRAQKMHATRAFGVMLGCDAPPWPTLPDFEYHDTLMPTDDGVLMVSNICPPEDVDWFRLVKGSKVVVGPKGLQTYLGSIMGKDVVEIYPDDIEHTGWMSKFGRGSYHLVKRSLAPEVQEHLVARSIKICLAKYRTDK